MDLVFIYGPPGVGKLTVAKELARLTGYRLFDNHMSIDWQFEALGFDFDTPEQARVVNRLLAVVFEEAARAGVSLVFTFVYDHLRDAELVADRCAAVEANGGRVCLVKLICEQTALESRVKNADRIARGKLSSLAMLRMDLKRHDFFASVPNRNSLRIDNTNILPGDAAAMIVAHYGLKAVE